MTDILYVLWEVFDSAVQVALVLAVLRAGALIKVAIENK